MKSELRGARKSGDARVERSLWRVLFFVLLTAAACDTLWGFEQREIAPHMLCRGGSCACVEGFADCNANPVDGCEADLTTKETCGGCGNKCANGDCEQRACLCKIGFADCDGRLSNGCETDLNTNETCGGCGNACGAGNCQKGMCLCDSVHADCNGRSSDGCETALDRDPANCGQCGHDCQGGECKNGDCQMVTLVAPSTKLIYGDSVWNYVKIVADGHSVYVTSCGTTGSILRIPASGGAASVLFKNVGCPSSFLLEEGTLYWKTKGVVFAAPASGASDPRVLVVGATEDPLAVGGGYLYWHELSSSTPPRKAVNRILLASLAVEKNLWTYGSRIAAATSSKEDVFFLEMEQGLVAISHQKKSARVLAPADVASGTVALSSLATYGGRVFWSNLAKDEIHSVSAEGGPISSLAKDAWAISLAVDQKNVYWLDSNFLGAVPKTGEAKIVQLVSGLAYIDGQIAIDEKAVYWVIGSPGEESGSYTLAKIAK